MALSNIEIVRLRIGDTASSFFYPLLSDDEIEYFITSNSSNIDRAVKQAAISCSMIVSGIPIREKTGDIEVWNNISKTYLAALENIIKETPNSILSSGITPYAAGISWDDLLANLSESDNIIPALTKAADKISSGQYLDTTTGQYVNFDYMATDC